MNRTLHCGATVTAWRILLIVATLLACGCGGGNGVGSVGGGDGGDDGSGDATADGSGDGSPDGSTDAGTDRGVPRDGAGSDAPEDQSVTDSPSDRGSVDAPADQTSDVTPDQGAVDAPADVPSPDAPVDGPPDAPADVVTVCDAVTCPTGCCQGNTCMPGTDPGACGAAGAACAMCPGGETCTAGACSGCNAASCPTGCCSGSTCTMPPSASACGTGGAACTSCGSGADGCSGTGQCTCGGGTACGAGQECSGGKCVCNAASCPTGCCNGNTCTTSSATTCGTAGAACVDCGSTGNGCSANGTCTCGGGNACGTGQVCSGGACKCDATSCPTGCCQGNTCQPGNTTSACGPAGGTCAMCTTGDSCTGGMCIAPTPVCGNGIREGSEQCDDGKLVDLDGCDSNCQFEQVTRATQIVLQWAADSYCTADTLLAAIKDGSGFLCPSIHGTIQGDLNTTVTQATDNLLFKYFSITDLTGQSGTASVGSYNATLTNAYTGTFTGNADLDWWYTLDTTTAGASPLYTPTAKESAGTFTSGTLNASGGHVWVSAFGTSLLDLANVKLQLPIAKPATKPTASTGTPPGHLSTENLESTLVSFPTAGGTNTTPAGLLCGDTTAYSLTQTAVPPQFQSNCAEKYGATNNMLDVFVNGCTINLCGGAIIAKTQPDAVDPDAPSVGAGAPYTFQVTGNAVTGCKDKSGTSVSLSACEAAAAYSTYLKITVDRVILKHP